MVDWIIFLSPNLRRIQQAPWLLCLGPVERQKHVHPMQAPRTTPVLFCDLAEVVVSDAMTQRNATFDLENEGFDRTR